MGRKRLDHIRDPAAADRQQIDDQPRTQSRAKLNADGVQAVDELRDLRSGDWRPVRRREVAIAVDGDLPQLDVEQVRGDITHPPVRSDGLSLPVVLRQRTEQRQQFGEQRSKEVGGEARSERFHVQRRCAPSILPRSRSRVPSGTCPAFLAIASIKQSEKPAFGVCRYWSTAAATVSSSWMVRC